MIATAVKHYHQNNTGVACAAAAVVAMNPNPNLDDKGDKGASSASDRDEDERLNFYSERFDPVLALRTPTLRPPVGRARVFDNLAMYESHVKRTRACASGSAAAAGTSTTATPEPKPAEQPQVFERRFLPHQMPITKERKQRKPLHNIFTRMESYRDQEGVFGVLERARTHRLVVNITIRHSHGVRGVCVGVPTAFDKFWNITLAHVDEYWIRRKKMKVPVLTTTPLTDKDYSRYFPKDKTFNLAEVLAEGEEHQLGLPDSAVIAGGIQQLRKLAKLMLANAYGRNKKNSELCFRHVHELLIRGEQIVVITL